MTTELIGDMVFDTSAFIELLNLTPKGSLLKDSLVSEKLFAHISEVSLSEVVYILCRRIGYEKSISAIRSVIDTQYFDVVQSTPLYELAGRYKCERALSIVDCYSLALGKHLGLPILFAMRETELAREIKRKAFDVKLVFLHD